jgi:hypothetical protein
MICNIQKLEAYVSRMQYVKVPFHQNYMFLPLGSDNDNYDCSQYDDYDYNSLSTFGRLESDNR